jgi:hypothetical protein
LKRLAQDAREWGAHLRLVVGEMRVELGEIRHVGRARQERQLCSPSKVRTEFSRHRIRYR